jgi:hypothetical protein
MQIFEDQHQGANACPAPGQRQGRIEELFPTGRGVHGRNLRVAWVHS